MAFKKKTTSTPDADLVPADTAGEADLNKCSPPLDIRFNVLNPSSQDLMTILVDVPRNTPIPDATNTPVEPTEVFKTIVSDITEALTFLIETISHEPETGLLQMEEIKQDPIDDTTTYKEDIPNPNKKLLLAINAPPKIFTGHLQEY